MTRLLVLLVVGLMSQSAAAEVAVDAGMVVNEQAKRVQVAYDRYIDACFELSEQETAQLASSMSGTLQPCEAAKEAYDREGNLLVRLIHGDASMVVCVDDGNCSWSVEEISD